MDACVFEARTPLRRPLLEHISKRRLYYALVRTLIQGESSDRAHPYPPRPAIPLELVIRILREAQCIVLSPLSQCVGARLVQEFQALSVQAQTSNAANREIPEEKEEAVMGIVCMGEGIYYCDWFLSAPLQPATLANICCAQLFTRSANRDRMHNLSSKSRSWFEIALVGANGLPRMRPAPEVGTLSWRSHDNGPPGSPMKSRIGVAFGSDHELWRYALPGDRIGVQACVESTGSQNVASAGMLRVVQYFVPSFIPK